MAFLVASCYIAGHCLVAMNSTGTGAGVLKRYSWFVIAYSLIMFPSVLDYLIIAVFSYRSTPIIAELSIFFKSAAGLVLSTIRLTDPIVIAEFKRAFGARRSSTLEPVYTSQLLSDPSEISVCEIETHQDFIYNWIFQDVVSDTLQSTLSSICLSLKHLAPANQTLKFDNLVAWNLFYYKQTNTWEISPEDVLDLSPQYLGSLAEPVRIIEHAPVIFAHLRHLDHISNDELAQ